jgi:membrane protease YdiL (CAAX protease family)
VQIPSARLPNATFATLAALVAFAGVYAASVARLAHGPFPLEEAISILVVMGAVFPALALLLLKGVRPLAAVGSGADAVGLPRAAVGSRELAATGALFLVVVAFLAGGSSAIDALLPTAPHSLAHETLVLVKKLAVFVVLPYAVLRVGFGRTAADFGLGRDALRALWGRPGLAVTVLALAFCAFQWFAGRAAAPLRDGEITGVGLLVGVPLSFAWMTVEAGLVEEFFFRAVLQDRLGAALRSPGAAVFVGALLFGLAHAPGYVLRGAGVDDGLGAAPGVLDAAAYAIAVPAIASFVFAVLWLRTRNLWVGMLVHGAVDALPNVAETVRAWGLG